MSVHSIHLVDRLQRSAVHPRPIQMQPELFRTAAGRSIAVLFYSHGKRQTYFQQTGKLAGNQKLKVIQGVRYGNIVVQLNLNRTAGGITIQRSQSNIFASASQADFNHFAPYCRVR